MPQQIPGPGTGLLQLLENSYAGWTRARPYPLPHEPPVAPGILHVIVKDKLINSSDQIEIVLPWYVVGLDNGDFLMLFFHNLVKLMKPPPKVKTKNRFKKNIPPRHFKEVDKGRK